MWNRILAFVAITYVISFIYGYAIYSGLGAALGPLAGVLLVLYMYIPAAVVFILQRFVHREPLRLVGVRWGPNRWWLAAWLIPPSVALITFGVSLLFPGIRFSPDMEGMFERFGPAMTPDQLQQMREVMAALPVPAYLVFIAQGLIAGLIAGVTINAVAAFGEELGWRGFMQKHLLPLGFWPMVFLTGLVWGIWHAPLVWHGYNYPQHPGFTAIGMMTIWTILLSPVMGWVTLRGRSVLAAAIFHGTLNGTARLALIPVAGGDDLTTGVTGLPGFVVLAVVNALVWLLDRRFIAEQVARARFGPEA